MTDVFINAPVRRLLLAIGAVTLALGLGGCASRGGKVPYEPAGFAAPDLETLTPSPGQQKIGQLDKLKITVFQVADLSGEFHVDSQGKIQFPLIGDVVVQGLLPNELSALIARRLGERYLRAPNVQVAVLEQTQQSITIDGSVRKPGVSPILGTTTLMRAVALAGGLSEEANPARVVVFRTIDGQRMAAAFDLRSIRRAEAEDPVIYGNDVIVVDGLRARSLLREVLSSIPLIGYFAPIL